MSAYQVAAFSPLFYFSLVFLMELACDTHTGLKFPTALISRQQPHLVTLYIVLGERKMPQSL